MKFHIIHNWTKWKQSQYKNGTPYEINIYNSGHDENSLPIHSYIQMQRTCVECDLIQFKRIEI